MNKLKLLSTDDIQEAVNSFSDDIRQFKTIFSIVDSKAMLDFVLWILSRCENTMTIICPQINSVLEFLFELMRHEVRNKKFLTIIVEESFEEIFITMKFEHPVDLKPKAIALRNEMGNRCVLSDNIACIRFRIHEKAKTPPIKPTVIPVVSIIEPKPEISVKKPEVQKEIKVLETKEKEMLRQSFVHKTAAIDYIQDIGGDVLDEIRDLESLDEEWIEKLQSLETEPSIDNIRQFADGVLGIYVKAINNLFEFTALGYALASLGTFMKEHADEIIGDSKKLKTLVILTEHLGSDLTSWREHIFGLQDTADIHYLDSSFFSSCMQIEQIIGNKEVASNDDDDDGMEFF